MSTSAPLDTDDAQLARVLSAMPTPTELGRLIQARINELVGHYRYDRTVTTPDDVFELTRRVMGLYELLHDVARVWEGGSKRCLQVLAEEQIEAHGEDDGIPRQPLTVPDQDGTTITVSADVVTSWLGDPDTLADAVAVEVLAVHGDTIVAAGIAETPLTADALHELQLATIRRFLELGRFEAQVSKVRVFANAVSLVDPKMSGAARGAMRRTRRLRGTRAERKRPNADPTT